MRRRAYVAFNGAGGSKNSRIKDPLKRVYGPDMIFADSTACMFGFAMLDYKHSEAYAQVEGAR